MTVYLHVEDAWTLSLLRQYADAMKVLSRSSNLTLSQDFTHTGAMGLFSVNIQPGITLHMQLQVQPFLFLNIFEEFLLFPMS